MVCIWSSWCHCHLSSLASLKSRMVLPFWCSLIQVVLEIQAVKQGCCCVLLSQDVFESLSNKTRHLFYVHSYSHLRPHCVRVWPIGDQVPPQQPLPTFRPMSIVAKWSPISATAELLFSFLRVKGQKLSQTVEEWSSFGIWPSWGNRWLVLMSLRIKQSHHRESTSLTAELRMLRCWFSSTIMDYFTCHVMQV